jgi:hypothetical protein
MGRRANIRMSDDEVRAFLEEERTVICATNGPRGWPHLMPLWYVLRATGDGGAPEVWAWTFAKSQKAVNIGRDARATLQVEAGDAYDQLRGVMFECDVAVHAAVEDVRAFGLELYARYAEVDDDVRAMVDAQAPKRIAMQFVERRRATWDHRKLGGVY